MRPDNDRCESAFEIPIDGGPQVWSTVNATQGMQCRQTNADGPGVWFRFAGNEARVTITTCDDVGEIDSGFNIFVSDTGSCNDLRCTLGSRTRGGTCESEAGTPTITSVTFQTRLGSVYFINVLSSPPNPTFDFDIDGAGTTGLVQVFTAV